MGGGTPNIASVIGYQKGIVSIMQIISRLRIRKLLMLSGCTKGQSAIMLRKLFRTAATCLRRTTIFEPQNNNELEKPGFHFWIPVVLFSFFVFPTSKCKCHSITHFGEIKECKCMVILRDFPATVVHCLGWCNIMTPEVWAKIHLWDPYPMTCQSDHPCRP